MLAKAFRCRIVLQMILQAETGTAEQHSCHFCNIVFGERGTKTGDHAVPQYKDSCYG